MACEAISRLEVRTAGHEGRVDSEYCVIVATNIASVKGQGGLTREAQQRSKTQTRFDGKIEAIGCLLQYLEKKKKKHGKTWRQR